MNQPWIQVWSLISFSNQALKKRLGLVWLIFVGINYVQEYVKESIYFSSFIKNNYNTFEMHII